MSDKITKLSDAIALGSTFRSKSEHVYFTENKSCALGAAYEACTGIYSETEDGMKIFMYLKDRFNLTNRQLEDIMEKNDSSKEISREDIAKDLRSIGY